MKPKGRRGLEKVVPQEGDMQYIYQRCVSRVWSAKEDGREGGGGTSGSMVRPSYDVLGA